MSDKPETISVVVAHEGGRPMKAYASKDAALIIDTSNLLRDRFEEITIFTCELINEAPPRPRKSRAKGDPE